MYVHTCIYICIHMYMYALLEPSYAQLRLPSPPTLQLPLRRLTSKLALVLPFVYGHVLWLKKCISSWFHCQLSGGRRPTLYFTVF